jgi:hypothetical protein
MHGKPLFWVIAAEERPSYDYRMTQRNVCAIAPLVHVLEALSAGFNS